MVGGRRTAGGYITRGCSKALVVYIKKIYDFLKDTYIYVPNHSRICSSQFSFCIRVVNHCLGTTYIGKLHFMRFNFS